MRACYAETGIHFYAASQERGHFEVSHVAENETSLQILASSTFLKGWGLGSFGVFGFRVVGFIEARSAASQLQGCELIRDREAKVRRFWQGEPPEIWSLWVTKQRAQSLKFSVWSSVSAGHGCRFGADCRWG